MFSQMNERQKRRSMFGSHSNEYSMNPSTMSSQPVGQPMHSRTIPNQSYNNAIFGRRQQNITTSSELIPGVLPPINFRGMVGQQPGQYQMNPTTNPNQSYNRTTSYDQRQSSRPPFSQEQTQLAIAPSLQERDNALQRNRALRRGRRIRNYYIGHTDMPDQSDTQPRDGNHLIGRLPKLGRYGIITQLAIAQFLQECDNTLLRNRVKRRGRRNRSYDIGNTEMADQSDPQPRDGNHLIGRLPQLGRYARVIMESQISVQQARFNSLEQEQFDLGIALSLQEEHNTYTRNRDRGRREGRERDQSVSQALDVSNVLRRHPHEERSGMSETQTGRMANRLTDEECSRLPKKIIRKVRDTPSDCIICLEALTKRNTRTLQCLHTFHPACITEWLKDNATCPMCRQEVRVS